MFAWNCRRANGTHLTFCMDRFYFGSCCRLPEEYYIKVDTTTVDVSSDLTTTTVSKSTSASPIISDHTISTSVPVAGVKTSTKGSDHFSTKAPYPTPSSFPPGLVTWRPLEAPHEVPDADKRKPTTPMLSSTVGKLPVEHVTKTKVSTKHPFPAFPTVPGKKTKPTASHPVKVPKPTPSSEEKVKTQRPETSSSLTTPQRVVRPRPTAGQGVAVSVPTTPRTTDIPKSTKPHLTEISTSKTETTTKILTPTKPSWAHIIEISTPTTAHPLEKISEPDHILSSKPEPVSLQGLPHEASAFQPPIQHEIKTPKPTVDRPHPPHVVEILRPGSSPSSLEVQEPAVSVKTEESTTATENKMAFTTPVSERFPPSPGPSFIEVISTDFPVGESSSQTSIRYTTRTTQRPTSEVTTSRLGLDDIFQVTSFLSKEGSPEDSSLETTVTSSTTSRQEEFDVSHLTDIQDTDASVIPVRETEVSDVYSTTQEIDSLNGTEIMHMGFPGVANDTTLHEINYETDSQSPAEETQSSASPALPQTTTPTVFHSIQTDKEIQTKYPATSETTEKETDVASFSTTPFKCKSSTEHSTTESDFTASEENADFQQLSHINGTTEEDMTKQDSSLLESDMTHVTSAATTPEELDFVSHFMPQTTDEDFHSSLPVSLGSFTVVSEKETEPSYSGSTENAWDPDHSSIGTTGSQEKYQSSDISLAAEAETQSSSDLSWTSVTTGDGEDQTLSEMTTTLTSKQDIDTFETSESSESEDSSSSDVTKEMTSQPHSAEDETFQTESAFSLPTSTVEAKVDIGTHLQSLVSTAEYSNDAVNLTTNTEVETSTTEKLPSEPTQHTHSLNVTHPEFVEVITSTKTPAPHTEETIYVEEDIFTSAAFSDSDQTSERYVHSSVEETKLNTEFSIQSTSATLADNDLTTERHIQSSVEETKLNTEFSTQSPSATFTDNDLTTERYFHSSVEETKLDTESRTQSISTTLADNDLTSERYVHSSVEETKLNTEFSAQSTSATLGDSDLASESYFHSSVEVNKLDTESGTQSTSTILADSGPTSESYFHSSVEETKLDTESSTHSTSTTLADNDLTSEKYVYSSLEETEQNKESSTQSTISYSSTAYEGHSTETFGTEGLTTESVIHDFGVLVTQDTTPPAEKHVDGVTTSDIFSKIPVTQDITDHSTPQTETMLPLEKATSEETASQTIFENTSEEADISFSTSEEKTEKLTSTFANEYVTKKETQKTTTYPDVPASDHTLANDEVYDSITIRSTAITGNDYSITIRSTAITGNDSLDFVPSSVFITAQSKNEMEESTTYPSTSSTYNTANLAETFSVDVDYGTDFTSLPETSKTTQTEQDTPQTSSEYRYNETSDITVKYVTSSTTFPDSDSVIHSITTVAEPLQENASTTETSADSSDAGANAIGTTSILQKNTTYIVETTRPWEEIAAGVIEILQGAESRPSSPKTTTPPNFELWSAAQKTPPSPVPPHSTSSTTGIPVSEPPTTIDLSSADYTQVCGRPLPGPVGRIVGGGPAHFGEWPWVVSLRQWKKNTFLHKCGAALVNEFWVITAAHCIEGVPLTDILLRLGEYDITHEEEPLPFVERRIQIVAAHPKFDKRTFEYDLALLRFYEPVTFQRNIIPICIPEGNNSYVGKHATVAGWGRLYEDGPLPNVIQEVALPVITNDLCEEMYRKAGFVEDIPDIFICAGYGDGGKDSCEGDSGGPMVIQEDDGRWVLAGVISWGIGCALPNQPGVYTRITKFSKWINQIIVF